MKQAPLIVVIYDGIDNSVFDSQVIHPLMAMIEKQPAREIVLVSFEHQNPSPKTIQNKIPQHPSFAFIMRKKIPYIGLLSLYFAAHALKKILKKYSVYDLQARGPLAGFVCQKALQKSSCNSFIIQARGLLAEEYGYEHTSQKKGPVQSWHMFRQWQFFNLEKKVYGQSTADNYALKIQAVSKALAEYLITEYDANRSLITVAHQDIPAHIEPSELIVLKQHMRNELAIDTDATVYCYNGSIKAWQCPELVIEYFKQKYQENSRSILYILTQDKQKFKTLIEQHAIPTAAYRVLSVSHKDIYRYLAAADIGIIFRQPHVVNWVSRPTKALEYTAAGLKIEHNNTVAWLFEQEKNTMPDLPEFGKIKITQEVQQDQTCPDLTPSS